MAYIDTRTAGKFIARIPTGQYITDQRYAYSPAFESRPEAEAWGARHEALLASGVVPDALVAKRGRTGPASPLLINVMRDYQKAQSIAPSDEPTLLLLIKELKPTRIEAMTHAWALDLVATYKEKKLAPSTIRKRIESLARVVDWHFKAIAENGKQPAYNPLRDMPTNYSAYADRSKKDVKRDFRLTPENCAAIEAALAGEKREDRQRALVVDPDFAMLYALIVDTGLRLREAYTLRVGSLNTHNGVLAVNGTKGHYGAAKPRNVPLKSDLFARMKKFCANRDADELMFPFWDGTEEGLAKCSVKLSKRFAVLFDYAGCGHITEHDLRHEAVCRWVLLKNASGQWALSDTHLCRVMGWEDGKMLLRYASLRGDDLAALIR